MKKAIIFAATFCFLPMVGLAGYGKGNHVVTGSLGGVMAADEFHEGKGAGWGAGAAYRYYLSDMFSLGADLALDDYGSHFSEEDRVDVDVSLLTTSLLGRIDFWPRNTHATYFALGAGGHHLEQTFHDPGHDRTTSTERFGVFLALGFEAPLPGTWMWGGELRSVDPLGVSANALGLKLTLSRRFGKDMTHGDGLIK